jgi:hypothetical protein
MICTFAHYIRFPRPKPLRGFPPGLKAAGPGTGTPAVNFPDIKPSAAKGLQYTLYKTFVIDADHLGGIGKAGTIQILVYGKDEVILPRVGTLLSGQKTQGGAWRPAYRRPPSRPSGTGIFVFHPPCFAPCFRYRIEAVQKLQLLEQARYIKYIR